MKRIPILPTIIVLLAVVVMVRLGFWQLDRLAQKEVLLARYGAAHMNSNEVEWNGDPATADGLLYRRVSVICKDTANIDAIAGRNDRGMSGFVERELCVTTQGFRVTSVIGWSKAPYGGEWQNRNRHAGEQVHGILAPGPRLVADPPLGGLAPNAKPDPSEIANNHLAYAVQWFLFALTALAIYGLALRKRWLGGRE